MIADDDEKKGKELLTKFCKFGPNKVAFIKTERDSDILLKS